MSYDLDKHLKAERSRKSRHAINTFRRLRKEFIKYGKRRNILRPRDEHFVGGAYVTKTEHGRATGVRTYLED